MVALIDMLKESILRTGCLEIVSNLARGARLSPETLAQRLMLAIYGYGTNIGIRGVAAGDHGHSEDDLRYVRRRLLTPELVRSLAIEIANATFARPRSRDLGAGVDHRRLGLQAHRRARPEPADRVARPLPQAGRADHWHVEKKSVAIHSQLISCSAMEVAAMIDGAMRHGTTMDVEGNYTDTHGQSWVAFGITRLLGFLLLPRIKGLNRTKLYQAERGDRALYPGLVPALTRPIRWDRIAEQYEQMIKYATAIRTRTAQTEAILRRFMQANAIHPTYQAMIELGRAQKTIFLCRYLRDRQLQHEVQVGLNVVEGWHRGVRLIFFGGGGDIPSNRRDEQELSVLCLGVLQAAMVYINTLMLQDILHHPAWADRPTAEDKRGITPLIWGHVVPHGEIRLDMGRRLELAK